MEEQQNKDYYTRKDEIYLLQDKPKSESILKRLRSQTSREIGERLMTTTKTEAWTLLDKRANYILQKTIRMQMEAWTLLYIRQ